MSSNFQFLPIIDLSLDTPETRPELLKRLNNALFKVGFLYLVNHGLEAEAETMLELVPKAFDVPNEEKNKVAMTTNPHFVGYSQLGAETTAKKTDHREQYDFGSATDVEPDSVNPELAWLRLKGPTPYLPDSIIPGFKATIVDYMDKMNLLTRRLLQLIGLCLNLREDTFDPFQGEMNRLKIVKYPANLNGSNQGVGPHKDSSGMLTFVLQDEVGGLQVLNSSGEWIDAKPIKNSFVVNIAQGFEALTGGRCGATTHRVISPSHNVTRYSIPYFHSVRLNLTMNDIRGQLSSISGRIPEPVDANKRKVDVPSEFLDDRYSCFGEAHLRNRIKSHPDVAEIWYADVIERYHNT